MKRFTFSILIAILLFGFGKIQAAEGYEIKVKINNLKKNDTIYLAYHMGTQKYLRDTAVINDKGIAVFKGSEKLPGGIYLIVLPKKTYFDIIVNEQNFYIENDTSDFAKNFKSTGTEENRVFYEDLKFISEKSKQRTTLDDERKKESIKDVRKKEIEELMKKIDEEVKTYRSNIIKSYPKLFYSKVLNMMEEVKIPDPPKDDKGNITDSLFQYKYYRQHYFDNIDFADDRLLRTPILHNKVMYFIEKMTPQVPDSINVACDVVLNKAKVNEEMFKYWLIELLNYYAKSNIMGFDAVYVHLVENYYSKGMAKWANEADVFRITDRAKKLKPTLIGQIAPKLVLKDLKGVYHDLYSLKAKYTLLFIYDPDCGHCKKETPKFLEAYKKIIDKKIDFKVYAVSTEHLVDGHDSLGRPKFKTKEEEINKWPKFIEEFKITDWINVADLYLNNNFREVYDISSTPRAFLLDKDKKIIAKRFAAEQLEQIIDDLEKREIMFSDNPIIDRK
jgi:thiol-disulfide isomerase/thioredoxin